MACVIPATTGGSLARSIASALPVVARPNTREMPPQNVVAKQRNVHGGLPAASAATIHVETHFLAASQQALRGLSGARSN